MTQDSVKREDRKIAALERIAAALESLAGMETHRFHEHAIDQANQMRLATEANPLSPVWTEQDDAALMALTKAHPCARCEAIRNGGEA